MATLIYPCGVKVRVTPLTRKKFTLEEVQAMVGGYVEMVPRTSMYVDEEGRLKNRALNPEATKQANGHVIVGTALIAEKGEF